ncbi:sensor histidine kinase [Nocardioides okcheonensis]|uniref:sensor histidine kinase n=1 Tax=Nocardioides okcheonensis TaxID=2894081 RepID=UPI001E42E524|nr:PAS domain-containing sensor histidine kinase [Nocardioides okcheonensis]UFN46607.1 PAS domain S-box protein [Nocardioides okcheonensis]
MPDTDGLWRLTMEHSPVGMALVSPEGEFLTANIALCDMLGYTSEELLALTFQAITHADDRASDARLLARAMSGEVSSFRVTKRYLRADGSVLVGDLSATLVRDDHGNPLHLIAQIVDLTERQAFVERLDAAEAEVESEQAWTGAILDSVSIGLVLLGADGVYQAHNGFHDRFLALAYPEGHGGVAGQSGFLFDAEQGRRLTREELPSVRALAGEEFDGLLVWVGEDPLSRRAVSISARPVRDRAGDFAGAVLAYHDITDLQRATRVKDDFVASVSHELRTPLTAALAYLELLDYTSGLPVDVHEHIGAARRNMMRLSHLVADLLFAVRATSGSPLVDPYRVDLASVVSEAVDAAGVAADARGVRIEADLTEPLVAVVDGLRLRQALDNLLANAVTYAQRDGLVRVALVVGEHGVELTVSDDGDGLEEAELRQMFARFFRGSNARARQVPGAGLGLSIVRTIVEAHGGEVTATSAPGQGTTVRVVLPR